MRACLEQSSNSNCVLPMSTGGPCTCVAQLSSASFPENWQLPSGRCSGLGPAVGMARRYGVLESACARVSCRCCTAQLLFAVCWQLGYESDCVCSLVGSGELCFSRLPMQATGICFVPWPEIILKVAGSPFFGTAPSPCAGCGLFAGPGFSLKSFHSCTAAVGHS